MTEILTDDWDYLGGFVVSRCDGCYRSCSVVSRYSAGSPTDCPYGVPNCEFYDVEESA